MNPILKSVSSALATDPSVREVRLGGSWARGEADEFSDIDLAIVAPDGWTPAPLGALWLAGTQVRLGDRTLWHGVLAEGTILDLLVVPEAPEGYLPLDPAEPLAPEPGSPEPPGLATDFWINSHKHRKVIGRGLEAMAPLGLHFETMLLFRMWVQLDQGKDPGPGGTTIHGLTHIVRGHVTPARRSLLGLPARNLEEVRAAIEALREEVAQVGRATEAKWDIPYPYRLDALVRGSDR